MPPFGAEVAAKEIENGAHVRVVAQAFVREQPNLVFGIDVGCEAQHQLRIGTGNEISHQTHAMPVPDAREHGADAVLAEQDRASWD
jgi:hypothetical protein